jgi:hypothetical protein
MRIALVLVVVACGGGAGVGTDPLSEDEARPLCEAACVHDVEDCGDDQSVAECTAQCQAEFAMGWFRGDAATTVLQCYATIACDAVDDSCFASIQPLAIHREWETVCRRELVECTTDLDFLCSVEPGVDTDEGFFRYFTPELMADILGCMSEASPCTDEITCIRAQQAAHGLAFE